MGGSAVIAVAWAVVGVSGVCVAARADPKGSDWPPAPLVSNLAEDLELTAEVRPFAEAWFDCSSHCAKVEDRLAFLQFPVEYVAPSGTIRTEAEERADFARSRASFADMDHQIQTFAAGGDPEAPVVDVTLRFSGFDKKTHRRFVYAIHQQWQLAREEGAYKIVKDYILAIDPV